MGEPETPSDFWERKHPKGEGTQGNGAAGKSGPCAHTPSNQTRSAGVKGPPSTTWETKKKKVKTSQGEFTNKGSRESQKEKITHFSRQIYRTPLSHGAGKCREGKYKKESFSHALLSLKNLKCLIQAMERKAYR